MEKQKMRMKMPGSIKWLPRKEGRGLLKLQLHKVSKFTQVLNRKSLVL